LPLGLPYIGFGVMLDHAPIWLEDLLPHVRLVGEPIAATAWGAQKEGQFLEVSLNPFVAMLCRVLLAVKRSPSCFCCLAMPTFEQGADAVPMFLGFDLCKLSSFFSCQLLCSK
jgi:hypothetical protein